MIDGPMTGVESRRSTVGPDPGEEMHRWLCECGRRGTWTHVEGRAVRGMAMHRYRHQQGEKT